MTSNDNKHFSREKYPNYPPVSPHFPLRSPRIERSGINLLGFRIPLENFPVTVGKAPYFNTLKLDRSVFIRLGHKASSEEVQKNSLALFFRTYLMYKMRIHLLYTQL